MSTTSTIAYCENQDVFDIYPQIDQYNLKRRLTSKWSGSGFYEYHNSGVPTRLFKNGIDLGAMAEDVGALISADDWFYNTLKDVITINERRTDGGTNPNLDVFEIGDIWEDVIERVRKKASRLIEAKLGKSISREILKDREGNYPTSIINVTALKTAILLIMAHDPNHPDLIHLKANYDDIIAKILSGRIVMTGHRSENDSKGFVRIVSEGSIQHEAYPTELRGSYLGSDYELLKITIRGSLLKSNTQSTRGDDLSELFFSVYGKSSDKLKDTLLVEDKLVSGDYQSLGVDDLYIRWGFGEYAQGKGDVLSYSDYARGSDVSYSFALDPADATSTSGGTTYHGVAYPSYIDTLGELYHQDAIRYTGPDGESIQDLYDEGLLENVTHISWKDPNESIVYNNLSNGTWTPSFGAEGVLYNKFQDGDFAGEKINYWIGISAIQSNIHTKDGLSIWSDYRHAPAEYEIELWGKDMKPSLSQTKSTTLSRDTLWL